MSIWNNDEVAALEKMSGKFQTKQIAEKIGRSIDSINSKARSLGISLAIRTSSHIKPGYPIAPENKDKQIVHYLKTELKQRDKAITKLQNILIKEQNVSERLVAAVVTSPAYPKWTPNKSAKSHFSSAHAMIALGDWHIGEVIKRSQCRWGIYNYKKAKDRMLNQFVPAVIEWIETQRSGYKIDDLTIVILGDMVSGEIHEEYKFTNEFPPTVAAAEAGKLLAEVIRRLASYFETVKVECVSCDNHGRLDKKPVTKDAYARNWSYTTYEIMELSLKAVSNVTINRPELFRFPVKVGDYVFLVEHGQAVRGWMGKPQYGWERLKGREAIKAMLHNKKFHYMILGHWHIFSEADPILNGCLSGTCELDEQVGRTSPPTQLAWLVGKKGVFGMVPFQLV